MDVRNSQRCAVASRLWHFLHRIFLNCELQCWRIFLVHEALIKYYPIHTQTMSGLRCCCSGLNFFDVLIFSCNFVCFYSHLCIVIPHLQKENMFFAIAGHKTHSMPSKFRELFFLQLKICICTLQKTMAQKDEVMYACNHSQRQQCTQQYTVSRRQRQRQNIHSIFVNIIHGTFTCIDCTNTPATAHATPFHFAHTETWNTQKRSIL